MYWFLYDRDLRHRLKDFRDILALYQAFIVDFFWKIVNKIFLQKTIYGPVLWMGFNCLKTTEPIRGDKFTFYHEVHRSSWYSFDQARKDERLSRLWNNLNNYKPLNILAKSSMVDVCQCSKYVFASIVQNGRKGSIRLNWLMLHLINFYFP